MDDMGLHGDEWMGESQERRRVGPPKFGRKARRWFQHAVAHWLAAHWRAAGDALASDAFAVAVVAKWYSEYAESYVVWVPTDSFAGTRHSWGAWHLEECSLEADLNTGLQEVHNRRVGAASAEVQTLDEWLRADIAGTLPAPGALGGSVHFSENQRRELAARRHALTTRGPLVCRSCQHRFKADRSSRSHCRDCRAAGKAPPTKRFEVRACAHCGATFEPFHWNAKQCEPCRDAGRPARPDERERSR